VTRFLLKRIGLALITLVLLSMIVFGVSTILPGDVGRAVLGPFAAQESVDELNEQLGTNRPVV
jgi:peptide/nickel transport system permease protein